MAREVDKRKTRKALRRLKRVVERVEGDGAPDLTAWEKDFVSGVTQRLETYGSAFRDPTKGSLEEALSQRQTVVARAIEKKSRPRKSPEADATGKAGSPPRAKARGGFKRKAPTSRARVRDINEDAAAPDEPAPAEAPPPPRAVGRPRLRVVPGGRKS